MAGYPDGFDISEAIGSRRSATYARVKQASPLQPHHRRRHKEAPQWCERRSVKRDCSFIETEGLSRALEDAKCDRARAVTRIEELPLDCVDVSDDVDDPTKLENGGEDDDDDNNADFAAASTSATSNRVFQPRLLKKRRKARQLGLDAFFRARPCT